jgi:3-isopropylmalate/(R)-2-methylmalate dehydratase small subunit
MIPFSTLTSVAVPFGEKNVDTDVIIAARHLHGVSRTGLGKFVFDSIRQADPANIFDQPRYAEAAILIAGDSFGCGSSREHAPWALLDRGFRCIIAPGFADIFAGNAYKNGLLLIELPQQRVDWLMAAAVRTAFTIDLPGQTIFVPPSDQVAFDIDPFRKACLVGGLDEIALTQGHGDAILGYEARRRRDRPYLHPPPVIAATATTA